MGCFSGCFLGFLAALSIGFLVDDAVARQTPLNTSQSVGFLGKLNAFVSYVNRVLGNIGESMTKMKKTVVENRAMLAEMLRTTTVRHETTLTVGPDDKSFTIQPTETAEEDLWMDRDNRSFKFSECTNGCSADAARKICEEEDAFLASCLSESDEVFFIESLKKLNIDFIFLGGNDRDTEGNWVWADGSAMNYTNWQEGEPFKQPFVNCLIIDVRKNKWYAISCGNKYAAGSNPGIVCERPIAAPTNSTHIDDTELIL